MDGGWHGTGVEWITNSKGWFEDTMGDTGLRLFVHKVTGRLLLTNLESWTAFFPGVTYKIAVPVVSLPVPAVVGIQINGLSGFVIGRPLPKGALTLCASVLGPDMDLDDLRSPKIPPQESMCTNSLIWQYP